MHEIHWERYVNSASHLELNSYYTVSSNNPARLSMAQYTYETRH